MPSTRYLDFRRDEPSRLKVGIIRKICSLNRRRVLIRVGFSARPLETGLKNPRPDGLGEYRRTIEIIKACYDWGLKYYNMPPETIGWGDYSKLQPDAFEVEQSFAPLLEDIRAISSDYDIQLSFHVRSSVVLTSADEKIRSKSIKEVLALRRGLELAGGSVVYVHPGYAHEDREAAIQRLTDALDSFPESPVVIGIETNDVGIGDLDTVLAMCDATKGAVPVIDWGHLWGLGYQLDTPEAYLSVIDDAEKYWNERVFFHFSSVSKRKHVPLDLNLPNYRIFAEAVKIYAARSDKDVIILVESPLRENDALLVQRAILGQEQEHIPMPVVRIGSRVTLEDQSTKETFELVLVEAADATVENEVSLDSPIGKAVVNRHEGETVTAAIPGSLVQYRIAAIA